MARRTLAWLSVPLWIGAMVAAAAAADGSAFHADLTATSLHASGPTLVAGPLVALLQETSMSNPGSAGPDFTLQAAHLRVETDSTDPSIHGTLVAPKFMPSTAVASYRNALVKGLSNGAFYRWNVFSSSAADPALATLSVSTEAGCAEARPSAAPSLSRAPFVADGSRRQATSRDISASLHWDCLEGASIQVKGDFWLSLWSWNATLTADGATQELHSGPQRSGSLPAGSPDASGAVSRDQEIYLYATNGTLTVPGLTARQSTFYTGPGTLLSATRLGLAGAVGRLATQGGDVDLRGSAVSLDGAANVALRGRGVNAPFGAALTGTPGRVVVDGTAVALPAPAPAAGSTSLAALSAGGVGLAAALAAVQRWRRPLAAYRTLERGGGTTGMSTPRTLRERQGQGYWALSSRAVQEGRMRAGLRYARRARRKFPQSQDAQLMEVIALYKGTRYVEALDAALRRISPEGDADLRSLYSCLAAKSALCVGRRDECLRLLKQALADSLEVFDDQVQDAVLDGLASDPWFRAVREGYRARPGHGADPSVA